MIRNKFSHIFHQNRFLNYQSSLQIFEKIKLECPDFTRKITPIKGDSSKTNLGISDTDCEILQAEVNVIFHVAATVRFDAPLKDAININVRSTRDLLEIAKHTRKLQVSIYKMIFLLVYFFLFHNENLCYK